MDKDLTMHWMNGRATIFLSGNKPVGLMSFKMLNSKSLKFALINIIIKYSKPEKKLNGAAT
jgi:hypothetical protein